MGRFDRISLRRINTPTFTIAGLTAGEVELIRSLVKGEAEADIGTLNRETQEIAASILRKMGEQ